MNEHDTLIERIDTWTQDVLSRQDKLQAWIKSTQSTNNAHKEAIIDELLGDDIQYKTVLVGKNTTQVWIDEDWQEAHDRSKY